LSTLSVETDTTIEVYFFGSLISGSFCRNLAVVTLTSCPTKRDSFITESMVSLSLEVATRETLYITPCESGGALLHSMLSCELSGSTGFKAMVIRIK